MAKMDDKLVEWFGASYRTSIAGWLTVIVSLVLLFGQELGITESMALKIAAALSVVTGGGLAMARDNKVTSEQAGAKCCTPKENP